MPPIIGFRRRDTGPPKAPATNNRTTSRVLPASFPRETLDHPRSQIEILRGQTSRHKIILLHGLTAAQALPKLIAR